MCRQGLGFAPTPLTAWRAEPRRIWLFCRCALLVAAAPLQGRRPAHLAMQVLQFFRFLAVFTIGTGPRRGREKERHDTPNLANYFHQRSIG